MGHFSWSLSSLKWIIVLCPPPPPPTPAWLICLRTFPWGAHSHLSQDGSQSEGFWEEQDSLWPGIILTFDSRKPLCTCIESPLSFTQGFCLSLSLPWLFPWDVYKRPRLAIYAVSVVTSILEGKQEAGCKFLNWSPPISCLRKCK